MSDIEQRLRALEDRMEIFELEGVYARSFDDHDGRTWSGLFTDDGIYQSRPVEGAPPTMHVQGSEALRAFCDDASYHGIHYFHLPQLNVDGDRATSRIHLEYVGWYPQEDGAPQRRVMGYYDVLYRRVEGQWKIERRVTTACAREQTTTLRYVSGNGLDSG